MSDQENPDRDTDKAGTGTGIIIGVAIAVVLALVGGLYAFSGSLGNGDESQQSASATCTVDEGLKAKLDSAATGQVAAFVPLDRALSATELAFNNEAGKSITIADWSGRTVLLNLWATWCAPCRAEMPALEELNREAGGEKFEVVAVSMDLGDPGKPKGFYQEIGLKDLRFFHDPDMALLNKLKPEGVAFGLPATLLIDGRGCVVGSLSGPAAWESEDAKALVRAAL